MRRCPQPLDSEARQGAVPGPGERPAASVVIGIRDWGLERLALALRSHRAATIGDRLELIVVDCGSSDREAVAGVAEAFAARCLFVESPVWNRSLALNAGIAAARAPVVITSDADFLAAPETHAVLVDLLDRYPNSLQVVQTADLPPACRAETIGELDWGAFEAVATLRPRWGMGFLAFRLDVAIRVRGYEERMVVWGAEDNDFTKRAREAGCCLCWVADPRARIYHVWHPPFLQTHPRAKAIFEANRTILLEDPSVLRNLASRPGPFAGRPMVSIVVATHNRAPFLRQAIESCLAQSFQDFEIVVVDDASQDGTTAVVAGFEDARIRYHRLDEPGGVGRARNVANQLARGEYILVHDDDDLMLPDRLALQLGCITAGVAGSYGGWIDFKEDGSLVEVNPGHDEFSFESMMFKGKVLLHPTMMVRREVWLAYCYHEDFASGSDYNLMLRMARDGVRLRHCGDFLILRRFHDANLTILAGAGQKVSGRLTTSLFLNTMPAGAEKSARERIGKLLPAAVSLNGREADILRRAGAGFTLSWLELPFEPSLAERIADSPDLPLAMVLRKAGDGLVTEALLVPGELGSAPGAALLSEARAREMTCLRGPAPVIHRRPAGVPLGLPVEDDGGEEPSGLCELELVALRRLDGERVAFIDFDAEEGDVAALVLRAIGDGEDAIVLRRDASPGWSLVVGVTTDTDLAVRGRKLAGSVRLATAAPASGLPPDRATGPAPALPLAVASR